MVNLLNGNDSIVTRQEASQPLILTLDIETEAHNYFDDLRKAYFPPERNFIDAHLTLFHALPDNPFVYDFLCIISKSQPTFSLNASGIVSIGNGTAIKIEAPILKAFHAQLQLKFYDLLTLQDRQKIWPHITVQNKVEAGQAKALQKVLSQDFVSFSFTARGLKLWRYCGGPWEFVRYFAFQ